MTVWKRCINFVLLTLVLRFDDPLGGSLDQLIYFANPELFLDPRSERFDSLWAHVHLRGDRFGRHAFADKLKCLKLSVRKVFNWVRNPRLSSNRGLQKSLGQSARNVD